MAVAGHTRTGTAVVSLDGQILEAQPTFNCGARSTATIGRLGVAGAFRHLVIARDFDPDDFPRGNYTQADLKLKLSTDETFAGDTAANLSQIDTSAVISGLAEGNGDNAETADGITYNTYDGSNNWPGGAGGTSDVTATNQVAFTLTGSTGDVKTFDIAAQVNVSSAAGDARWAAIAHKTSAADKRYIAVHTKEATSEADRPYIEYECTPEPYYTWMNTEARPTEVHATKAVVGFLCGSATFSGDTKARIAYGTTEALGSATDWTTLDTYTEDDLFKLAVTGLTADTWYYWRIEFDLDGDGTADFYTDTSQFTTQPAVTTPTTIARTSDGHYEHQLYRGNTDNLTVYAKTAENLAAFTDAAGKPISLWNNGGDDPCFCEAPLSVAFPLNDDGTSDVAADSRYAKSQDDCTIAAKVRWKGLPVPTSCMELPNVGNHEAEHWHFEDDNNGAISSDVASWMRTALGNTLGVPTSLASTAAADAIWHSSDSAGRWRAGRWGPFKIIQLNPYVASQYGITDSEALGDPLPRKMYNIYDWTLGVDQATWLIAQLQSWQDDGSKWLLIDIHHITGGSDEGSSGAYGRWDATQGEWWGDFGTDPYDYASSLPAFIVGPHALINQYAGKKAIVFLGHDHLWYDTKIDDVQYIVTPVPGGYDDGFDDPWYDGLSIKPSGGYLIIYGTPTMCQVTYYRTYVAGTGLDDPSDGITTNLAVVASVVLGGDEHDHRAEDGVDDDTDEQDYRQMAELHGDYRSL